MGPEESWRTVESQRHAIADIMESVQPAQWEQPSLCSEWRVRDVVAHLAMGSQRIPVGVMLRGAVRARGSFNRMNRDLAVEHARRPIQELIAELRQGAASREVPAVTNYRNILFDVLVHGQDITVPLGVELAIPAPAAMAAASTVWNIKWPLWTQKKYRGLRFVASDAPWTAGSGLEVRGPIAALLITLAGRGAALDRLDGNGVDHLSCRLPPVDHLNRADRTTRS
jgi:uncharacterized protein (TIGR03083 family)